MIKTKLIIGIIVMLSIILILNSISALDEDKINPEIYKSLEKNNETRAIIELSDPVPANGVIFKNKKSDLEISQERQEIKEDILQDIGTDSIKHEFDREIAVTISSDDIEKLKENPGVKEVKIDRPIEAFLQDSVPIINATLVWPLQISNINITGTDETVCILDTGANYLHQDLIGKNRTCVIDCIGKPCAENCLISDDNGHGTHVAGIVAATRGIKGVAIGAKLISVKVLNSAGNGAGSDLDAGMDWCISNSARYNISVISMSLGTNCALTPQYCYDHYCDNEPDESSTAIRVNNATSKNISVVIATGNNGDTIKISSPACIKNATSVGATDKSDNIASYSNRNNMADLFAPGSDINSTWVDGGYYIKSGTSMATPHIAGAFAIIRQMFKLINNRNPTPFEIQLILNSTGKVVNDSATGLSFSRINIYDAVISIDTILPNVTLISPINNQINASLNQTFFCNTTDNLLLKNITFYLWNSTGNLIYNETKIISGNYNLSSFNVTSLEYKNYRWNCMSSDANGNRYFANTNFTLNLEKTGTTLIYPTNFTSKNTNYTSFNCSAFFENFPLKNITFYLWNSTGNLIYNETKIISGNYNLSSFNYTFVYDGSYKWNCRSFNNQSNFSWAENYSLSYDPILPKILTMPISGGEGGGSSPGSNSATVAFTTDENTNVSINYGIAMELGSLVNEPALTSSHLTLIPSLASSTTYYYNITTCDSAGNCITNGTYSFITSAAAPIVQQNVGGGGGGGGSPTYKTYVPTNQQLSGGYTQDLNRNDKVKLTFFDISSIEHTLTVNEIKQNGINITIQSKPINLLLGIGQSAKLNLTSANYYDLYLKLESIEGSKAKLMVQIIHEEIQKPITGKVIEKPENNAEGKKTEEIQGNISYLELEIEKIKLIVYTILIMVILVIAFAIFKKRKIFEEKEGIKIEYRRRFNKHVNPKNI
ncbi:Tk-subtilisin [uncultured archaeon]|nr:Tk-subtilisin [uncultured archaeon]